MVRGPQPPPAGRPGRLCSSRLPHGCEPSASYSEPRLSRLQEHQRQADLGGLKAAVRGWGARGGQGALTGISLPVLGTSRSPAVLTVTGGVGDGRTQKASEGKGLAQGHTVSRRQNQAAHPRAPAPIQGFFFFFMKQVFFVLKTPPDLQPLPETEKETKADGGRRTERQLAGADTGGVGLPWEAAPAA